MPIIVTEDGHIIRNESTNIENQIELGRINQEKKTNDNPSVSQEQEEAQKQRRRIIAERLKNGDINPTNSETIDFTNCNWKNPDISAIASLKTDMLTIEMEKITFRISGVFSHENDATYEISEKCTKAISIFMSLKAIKDEAPGFGIEFEKYKIQEVAWSDLLNWLDVCPIMFPVKYIKVPKHVFE